MMDPTANSIKTGENGCDEPTIDMPNKKKLRLHGELSPNHDCRFIPRRIVRKYVFPQRDHLVVILRFERSNYDLCSQRTYLWPANVQAQRLGRTTCDPFARPR